MRGLRAGDNSLHIIGIDSSRYHVHQSLADENHLAPRGDADGYIENLLWLIARTRADLVWPTHDAEIQRISEAKDQLPISAVVPSADAISICRDKFATYELLESRGVPVPKTVRINSIEDLSNAFDLFGGQTWIRSTGGAGGKGAFLATNIDKAAKWLDIYDAWGDFTASEVLSSKGDHGWESIWKDGQLIAGQDMTRLVRGNTGISMSGVKSRGVILRSAPDEVARVAEQAVEAVVDKPDGIFRVDALLDSSGTPRVTEIEAGKFGADGVAYWHQFGYNFAYEAMRSALGEPVSYETPVLNPLPRDTMSISGLNQDITFLKLDDVAAGEADMERMAQ